MGLILVYADGPEVQVKKQPQEQAELMRKGNLWATTQESSLFLSSVSEILSDGPQ